MSGGALGCKAISTYSEFSMQVLATCGTLSLRSRPLGKKEKSISIKLIKTQCWLVAQTGTCIVLLVDSDDLIWSICRLGTGNGNVLLMDSDDLWRIRKLGTGIALLSASWQLACKASSRNVCDQRETSRTVTMRSECNWLPPIAWAHCPFTWIPNCCLVLLALREVAQHFAHDLSIVLLQVKTLELALITVVVILGGRARSLS